MTRRSFDGQATAFDARAGLPAVASTDVAAAVVALAGLGAQDLLVEVGAGSGEIGCHLIQSVAYVGIDIAAPMLDVFRARLGERAAQVRLEVADGDEVWPVDDGSARAVFGSRCLHLLSLAHLLAEIDRVGAPGGVTLLVGRVARDDQGARMWMRRQMRWALRDAGFAGRSGGGAFSRDLVAACTGPDAPRAAAPIEPRVVARWTSATSPADALAAWSGKDGLAGIAVDAQTKREVLERVRERAVHEFGDLERRIEAIEEYVLAGVHFS